MEEGTSGEPNAIELSGVVATEDWLSVGVNSVRRNDPNGEPLERRVELVDDTELILDRDFLEAGVHGAANWNEDGIETEIGDGKNSEKDSSCRGRL